MKILKNFVANREICQRCKYDALNLAGLLQPLPITTQVWEDISIDFINGLSKALEANTIVVVVNQLTKYGHFSTSQASLYCQGNC